VGEEYKRCIGLVPLPGQLEYYRDIDVVIGRLSAAALQLVANYNASKVKKPLEWKDLICRQDWIGRRGKQETTLFQQELSCWNFYKKNGGTPAAPPMTVADLKVCISAASLSPLTGSNFFPPHRPSLKSPPQ
jgi:hypothetical protein